MANYVYLRSEPNLWTVGFYTGDEWIPESDHSSSEEAARRVHYLNGGVQETSWTKEWPGEPGRYWFWGQPYWHTLERPPRLVSVKVYRTPNSELFYLADGSYIYEGAEGVWCSAILPEPPQQEDQNVE